MTNVVVWTSGDIFAALFLGSILAMAIVAGIWSLIDVYVITPVRDWLRGRSKRA